MSDVILAGIVGSTAHGLSIEGQDDTDIMGIFIEPPTTVCGTSRDDHKMRRTAAKGQRSGPGDVDEIYYSLRKFGRLAAAGNPSILTLLFLDEYRVKEPAGRDLLWARDLFVTRSAGQRYLGYLRSQRGKLERSRGPGARRPELIEAHGYDTKYAMHMVRLAYQGLELMLEGRVTLPLPEPARSHCRAVRMGEIKYDRVLYEAAALESALVAAIDGSTLPERADREKVDQLLLELHCEAWDMEVPL